MSGTTLFRRLILLVALAASACATTPEAPTTQSLLDSMSAPRAATLASCQAANMAWVCQSSFRGRAAGPSLDERCACADQETLSDSRR
jgi:hypothetical protein